MEGGGSKERGKEGKNEESKLDDQFDKTNHLIVKIIFPFLGEVISLTCYSS